ncbi:hypothetical protein EHS25_004770 [Saitozyma podzolica]|uniref:Uncharacterized protein n=1 Tax=Saitozyma podzolica TaxID=1890683 RepID=A0A427Y2L8_9TREE|nr:hypothetical protein EHS25_004770 [Saitozyma podzolica]
MRSLFRHGQSHPTSELTTAAATAGPSCVRARLPSVTGTPSILPIHTEEPRLSLPFPVTPPQSARSTPLASPGSSGEDPDPTIPTHQPAPRVGNQNVRVPIPIPARARMGLGRGVPARERRLGRVALGKALFSLLPLALLEDVIEEDQGGDDGDDPLIPQPVRSAPDPSIVPSRRNTFAAISATSLPSPPEEPTASTLLPSSAPAPYGRPPSPAANALPAYSAHLANDELSLISTVRRDLNHPSAAFFSSLASSFVHATAEPSPNAQPDEPVEWSTGGKKLRVTFTRGGHGINANGAGQVYVKVGRRGVIEGRVEVGKVDHRTTLEVTVLGFIDTSCHVSGQYTFIDTIPLVRRAVKLFPPGSGVEDNGPNLDSLASPVSDLSPTSAATGLL